MCRMYTHQGVTAVVNGIFASPVPMEQTDSRSGDDADDHDDDDDDD